MQIIWGNWTEAKLNHILKEFSGISEAGSRINFISEKFLNTAYRESTLTGDADTPESLVINLEAVDCFTFIDYVEAMRQSGSFHEFIENLEKVRYNSGKAAFENRNHFFTDWREFNSDCVDDITGHVGLKKTRSITKILNLKTDGTCFLKGIQPKERVIKYIASTDVNHSVIEDLKTGDYAGIYSEQPGLDVSHVGIIIKNADEIYLRHASSAAGKVIDQDLMDYISKKPGLIIFRPLSYPKDLE